MSVDPSPFDLARRVMQRADQLATCSEEPDHITRRFATPALRRAIDTVAAWMRDAGMSVKIDNVGNLIGRYEGAQPDTRTLLLGSHLDSVRDAGRYDGPLGVLVALACVERLHAQQRRLPFAIEIVAFADEEGLRYHTAYLGSAVIAGSFDPRYLDLIDAEGTRMADAIRAFGGDPDALAADARSRDDLIGYCEVHIEQGPVLEAEDLPVGIVTGIAAQSRFTISFEGRAGHAGTVPMALRRDALCAAAEFVLAVEALANTHAGLVATVGQIAVEPGASNVIPGTATISLDVRHLDEATLDHAITELRRAAHHIADQRGVGINWNVVQESPAVPCSDQLSAQLANAITDAGYAIRRLPSGAGHDGVVMAGFTSIAMLFVRCSGGISHHPAEAVTLDDVAVAIDVISRFCERLEREERV